MKKKIIGGMVDERGSRGALLCTHTKTQTDTYFSWFGFCNSEETKMGETIVYTQKNVSFFFFRRRKTLARPNHRILEIEGTMKKKKNESKFFFFANLF